MSTFEGFKVTARPAADDDSGQRRASLLGAFRLLRFHFRLVDPLLRLDRDIFDVFKLRILGLDLRLKWGNEGGCLEEFFQIVEVGTVCSLA